MMYHDGLKTLWKGSKSMVGHCNNQNDHNCPPITFAPQHPILCFKMFFPFFSCLSFSRTFIDHGVQNVDSGGNKEILARQIRRGGQ